MTTQNKVDRRSFLKISTVAGGGLVLGISWLTACQPEDGEEMTKEALAAAADFIEFNAYLQIAANGLVTIMSPNPEIGQGVKTSMPMIVAEELDVAWDKVVVEQAPLNTEAYDRQVAGGSYSIRSTWDALRKAGATARQMLVQAAADQWGVSAADCQTEAGKVMNGDRELPYGELVDAASQMEAPQDVTLKQPGEFKLLGRRIPNVDNHEIVTGQPLFGADTRREGMRYAMVVRPPAFGQKLKSVDDAAAKQVAGVSDVITFDDKIAVIAASTWQAKKGRDALRAQWEDPQQLDSSSGHNERFEQLTQKAPDEPKRKNGDVVSALRQADKLVEGVYECPFLPHNPMEPMNFFADVREEGVELYGPTQTPARARRTVSEMLDIPEDKITVGMTRMGGGFGRRLYADFVEDAARISSMIKAPVQVTWTREDDMTAGIYRPAGRYHYQAAISPDNELVGWRLRSAAANTNNGTLPDNFPAGAVPNFQVDYHKMDSHVTIGAWRAPNHNFVAFAEESFIDEIAHAMDKDPVAFRLELLDRAENQPTGEVDYEVNRYRKVIERAAEVSNWGQPKGDGVYQGIGAHFSYGSYVAEVAEVSVRNGEIKVHKVYAVVDCGIVVNRSGAETQVQGGVIDGIGHAMYGEQPISNGQPAHNNFDTFRLIRMREAPAEIEVHFIENNKKPEGLGEPGLPPAGAAVANAVFRATGVRMRKQPFVQNRLMG